MKKREFLKLTGIVGAGVVVSPFMACNSGEAPAPDAAAEPDQPQDQQAQPQAEDHGDEDDDDTVDGIPLPPDDDDL